MVVAGFAEIRGGMTSVASAVWAISQWRTRQSWSLPLAQERGWARRAGGLPPQTSPSCSRSIAASPSLTVLARTALAVA